MTYNLHPLFVHFPIALLLLYSLIKILPFRKWFPEVAWRHIEVVLLLTGIAGALAALLTGELAERLARPDEKLVEMHSTFADISTWLYGALLLGEILSFLNPWLLLKFKPTKILSLSLFSEKVLTNSSFAKILAVLGLLAISVTGLLGGVMVYGLSADPVAKIILNLLGLGI